MLKAKSESIRRAFSFNKGTIKLKQIDTIEVLSEKTEYGVILS